MKKALLLAIFSSLFSTNVAIAKKIMMKCVEDPKEWSEIYGYPDNYATKAAKKELKKYLKKTEEIWEELWIIVHSANFRARGKQIDAYKKWEKKQQAFAKEYTKKIWQGDFEYLNTDLEKCANILNDAINLQVPYATTMAIRHDETRALTIQDNLKLLRKTFGE